MSLYKRSGSLNSTCKTFINKSRGYGANAVSIYGKPARRVKQKVYKECSATGDGCLKKELEAAGIQSRKSEKVIVASGGMSGLVFEAK